MTNSAKLSLLVILLSALCACGGGGSGTSGATPPPVAGPPPIPPSPIEPGVLGDGRLGELVSTIRDRHNLHLCIKPKIDSESIYQFLQISRIEIDDEIDILR